MAKGAMRADASDFVPTEQGGIEQARETCVFFVRGFCRYGADCAFYHPDGGGLSENPQVDDSSSLLDELQDLTLADSITRDMAGARVVFGPGGAIESFHLLEDFSAVLVSGLDLSNGVASVQAFLSSLGYPNISPSYINIGNPNRANNPSIKVHLPDPNFASSVISKFTESPTGAVSITKLPPYPPAPTLTYPVLCTWYKPSKLAWLHFKSQDWASSTVAYLNTLVPKAKIHSRSIDAKLQPPPSHIHHNPIWSVQIGNLHPATTEQQIRAVLGPHQPKQGGIVFSNLSYGLDVDGATRVVERLVRAVKGAELGAEGKGLVGPLEVDGNVSSTRVKGVIRLGSEELAERVVREVRGVKVPELGNSPLFLARVVEVRCMFLEDVYPFVAAELEALRIRVWTQGQVHMKVGKEADSQRLVVRLYGEEKEKVMEVKVEVEAILDGTLLEREGSAVWDSVFDSANGVPIVQTAMNETGTFIYRDRRKAQVRLYGSTEMTNAARAHLLRRLHQLQQNTRILHLDQPLLESVLGGGFRRLISRFGRDVVKFNMTANPKTITVHSSLEDFELVRKMLVDDDPSGVGQHKKPEGSCNICWSQSTNRITHDGGHIYCGECLSSQCRSVSDHSTPLCCISGPGTCARKFSLRSLRTATGSETLDLLLSRRFAAYLQAHSTEYQYCPTPECDRIYRTSKEGRIFSCPSCLAVVCTTCQLTMHEGFDCAAYRGIVARRTSSTSSVQSGRRGGDDSRICPRCETGAMEKSNVSGGGANSSKCTICGAYRCFCNKVFDSGFDFSKHVQAEHGGTFEESDG